MFTLVFLGPGSVPGPEYVLSTSSVMGKEHTDVFSLPSLVTFSPVVCRSPRPQTLAGTDIRTPRRTSVAALELCLSGVLPAASRKLVSAPCVRQQQQGLASSPRAVWRCGTWRPGRPVSVLVHVRLLRPARWMWYAPCDAACRALPPQGPLVPAFAHCLR